MSHINHGSQLLKENNIKLGFLYHCSVTKQLTNSVQCTRRIKPLCHYRGICSLGKNYLKLEHLAYEREVQMQINIIFELLVVGRLWGKYNYQ